MHQICAFRPQVCVWGTLWRLGNGPFGVNAARGAGQWCPDIGISEWSLKGCLQTSEVQNVGGPPRWLVIQR